MFCSFAFIESVKSREDLYRSLLKSVFSLKICAFVLASWQNRYCARLTVWQYFFQFYILSSNVAKVDCLSSFLGSNKYQLKIVNVIDWRPLLKQMSGLVPIVERIIVFIIELLIKKFLFYILFSPSSVLME